MRILSKDTLDNIDEKIVLSGWIDSRRDHGKLIFIDLRDREGLTQVVFNAKSEELWEKANKLRPEWVVEIKGKVSKRPRIW